MRGAVPAALAARLDELLSRAEGKPLVVAIDGPCGSGKTTLAAALAQRYAASVFHCDDYFPQPHQRTEARRAEPGGNLDRDRLAEEILTPLREGRAAHWRRFDCKTLRLLDWNDTPPAALNVVEGSYALHPALRGCYDLAVFLTCSRETQLERLAARGSDVAVFRRRWMPLEDAYFQALAPKEHADLVLSTDQKVR